MKNSLTMILLTHERTGFLERSFSYYCNFNYNLIIVDSSEKISSLNFKDYGNVSYMHLPGYSFLNKIKKIIANVNSEFVVFLSDDDFIIRSGLNASLDFLEDNKDYVLCHGYCMMYLPEADKVHYFYRDKKIKEDYSEDDPKERLASFVDQYLPPFYAVTRTDALAEWYRVIPDDVGFEYQEVGHAFYLPFMGKIKIISAPYVVRESNYISSDHGTDMLRALSSTDPTYIDMRVSFLSFMSKIISNKSGDSVFKIYSFLEKCILITVNCLSTGKSLTLEKIFYSRWPAFSEMPEWFFEEKQYMEMPYYNKIFFDNLACIDFLIRAKPVGKLQKEQLTDIFKVQNESFRRLSKDINFNKIKEIEKDFLKYPFRVDLTERLYNLLADLSLDKSAEVYSAWMHKLKDAAYQASCYTPEGIDYISPLAVFDLYQDIDLRFWKAERGFSKSQSKKVNEILYKADFNFSLYIDCTGRTEESLEITLNSLKNALSSFQGPSVFVFIDNEIDFVFEGLEFFNCIATKDLIVSLNSLMKTDSNQWFTIVKSGSEVSESGLITAYLELSKNSNYRAVYFDEFYGGKDGALSAAFRPSFNLDYILSFPAGMSKHWLFSRQATLDVGGFNIDLPDAFELDLLLRMINKGGFDDLAHIAEPLIISSPPVLENIDDERKAIESHLRERGYMNSEVHAPQPGRYQVYYNHEQQPIVSIIIGAEENLNQLQGCMESMLEGTSYNKFEILLFSKPTATREVRDWLAMLADLKEAKIRIIDTSSDNIAEQYNQVAAQAIGDYLLFLSPGVSVLSEIWLDELLNHAQRGEVGAVGAKLLSPDGKIAHAGHILGLQGPLGSPFVGEPLDAAGYMHRLQVDQNLSAVSGDCFMVLRELFAKLKGFEQKDLSREYLSADLCLRIREAGFLIVWTPRAHLMITRKAQPLPSSSEQDVMYAKWLPKLARDPAYNPNFSLSMPGGFQLADSKISWRPLEGFRAEPVVLVHPADLFGCGHYRVMQPFLAMKEAGLIDGAISTGLMHVTDLERYNPDTIILQRQIGDERIEAMQRMQRFSKAFKVYELDDYLPNLPLKSVHRSNMPKDILRSLRKGLSFVDRFVVSTEALAEAFTGLHGEIVVMENRLPISWWKKIEPQRRQSKKPRVGWAGGSSHTGDLELIADVVRDLADEVEWVFFGMCPDKLRPYIHEFHLGVAIEEYPEKLASLNLDLGLAPLEMNLFNECKSNLRLLEYGACGIPVICTDIRPYQNGFPVTRVRNRYKEWVDAIRMHLDDLDETARLGDELQSEIHQEWMLQGDNLQRWRNAWVRVQ